MRSAIPWACLLLACSCGPGRAPASAPDSTSEVVTAIPAADTGPAERSPDDVDFASDVQPILDARCMLCHFKGGKMYDKLPFDQAETIRSLGTALFTRIKDETEQATISAFLSQPAADPPGVPGTADP